MAGLSPDKNIPNSNSTAAEWISWHRELRSYEGRKKANQWFVKFWGARGGTGVRGNTSELRDYLKGVGLSIETTGVQDIKDFAGDVADNIGDLFTFGKWAGITLAAVGIGGFALLIYAVAKKPERILLATPAGRAGAASGMLKV